MKYDVFLSKNTKDIDSANKLFAYLENAKLDIFESSKSLPRLGIADYALAIDEALENSENMIVLCSQYELADGKGSSSNWVYYEWTSFRNELLSKRKKGNLITVLCDGVKVDQLPLGLRKYEAFELNTIEKSEILNYFKKRDNNKEFDSISSFSENDSISLDLKMFDFGHHFAICMFAKMQNKDDFLDLLQQDLNELEKMPMRNAEQLISEGPDDAAKEIKTLYGKEAAEIFSLGQYCGIAISLGLFAVLGANLDQQQIHSVFTPFINSAASLGIPKSVVTDLLKLIENKEQERVSLYYKVVRRAVAIRHQTSKICPHCGAIVSNDNDKCPSCMSTIE